MTSKKDHPDVVGRLAHPPYTEAQGVQPESIVAADVVPAHLLDGGEIVILAIKPSLWSVVFLSARWWIAMLMVIVSAGWLRRFVPGLDAETIAQAAAMVILVRMGFAVLQWVSRLYVLTNRRVMRLTGIMNVDLFECSLQRIQNTYLTLTWYERLTGVGTISFATAGTSGVEASWTHVNSPLELHERVRSAIHRAGGSDDVI